MRCDGLRYVRFDTRKPAKARGLPLTTVISRYSFQDILVDRCRALAPDMVRQGVQVMNYSQTSAGGVSVSLSDGTTVVRLWAPHCS